MDIEKDAKSLLEEVKKQREARGARPDSPSEKEKTKGREKKVDPEAEAKRDEEILKKKEEELSEEEKKRKEKLLEIKKKEEQKKKESQEKSNIQKRIDELTFKVKSLEEDRNATKKERDEAKAELAELKKQLSMTPEDILKKDVKSEVEKRIRQYLEEDKEKPREERREMSKEELEEWLEEDYAAAQEWLVKRSIRRAEEERGIFESKKQDITLKNILAKQRESEKKTFEKHPDLDVSGRIKELEKEGKKPDEIKKILCEENPKYKLCTEILAENPEKYLLSENGPELVVAEMEKRLSKKDTSKEKTTELEEVKKKLAEVTEELNRLKSVDVGISSNRSPETAKETELGKELKQLASELRLSPDKVLQRLKERELRYG